MKNLAVTFIFSLSSILGNYSYAQKGKIYLTNPSFEEKFLKYSVPRGWKDCGEELFPKESPPDVHPIVSQLFGVNQKPAHQSTYLGLVVRETGSWEAVSQKLVKPMKANQCYAFRIKMCRSENYKSIVFPRKIAERGIISKTITRKLEREGINFTDPIILRIWGGDEACDRKKILAESPLVKNKEWADYFFKIQPDVNYQSLLLEVFDGDEVAKFPSGNILLDDASPLIQIDCDLSEEQISKIDIGKYKFDLNLATITTEEDLEWFVSHYAFRLRFSFKNKLTKSAKIDFRVILAAMNKFPNQKLVVLLDGEDKWTKKQRVEAVLNQINSSNFPLVQCDVRTIKRKEKKEEWLVQDHGIFIKIIPNTSGLK